MADAAPSYKTFDQLVGNTPLVKMQRLPQVIKPGNSNTILLKLEGQNPTCSVKARAAFNMIKKAEERGRVKKGDTLIEPTSGNTGIALAAAAAILGYRMVLVMPVTATAERKQSMIAYGAELVETSAAGGMDETIVVARQMEKEGKGVILDQFNNQDNVEAHYETTGPEVWRDTNGRVTHFVSSMGTSGTAMGTGRYLKEKNPDVKIVGVLPSPGAKIPGIRDWPIEFMPSICDFTKIDMKVSQQDAEDMARLVSREEGVFIGPSSGTAIHTALEISKTVENATIVAIVCDWGDRYISSGLYAAKK